jgi:hypothetical protein
MMMLLGIRQFARDLTVSVLIPLLGMSASLSAQTHVVSPADLQRAAVAATTSRQHNLETINGFLSSPQMEKVLVTAGIDPAHVKTAVSALSDQELARLAARSEKVQADFAAGRLSDRDLLIVVLCLVALVVVVVAVR